MKLLIILGAVVTLAALSVILIAIRAVLRARKQNDANALKIALKQAVIYNMIAMFASALGLSMVIIGILLG